MYEAPDARALIAATLAEDLGVDVSRIEDPARASLGILKRDVTTSSTVDADARFVGRIVAREDCVVCGLPVVEQTFEVLCRAADLFDPVEVFPLVPEGSHVTAGTPVAEIDGLAWAVLAGERTALDLLMVLSGIATETAGWVEDAGGRMRVCDTRKTLPAMRALSKYAVRVGGGTNHRFGLYDMLLIKDNHLVAAGGVAAATCTGREAYPALEIEVEADTVEQAVAAVEAGAEMVLLDNMDDTHLAEAVRACRDAAARVGRGVLLEASGGIPRERLPELAAAGVDRVSSSVLTLGRFIDFGLDETTKSGSR